MMVWRKSSYSGNGMNCVEIAWRKSSYSGNAIDCVEVGHGVGIRDSKAVAAGHLPVNAGAWTSFLTAVKSSHLSRLG